MANVGGLLAKGSFFVGFFIDAACVYNYYNNPNSSNVVNPGKAILNTGVGAYGIWVNPVAGAIYFGVEAFYPGGIKGMVTDQGKTLTGLSEQCGCDASAAF